MKLHFCVLGSMASEEDNFNVSGPLHLQPLDWSNSRHRNSVAACLVQGVYALEEDRRQRRRALAPPWWEFFGFQLNQKLVDQKDQSFFGAIFEFKLSPDSRPTQPANNNPPKHVIAFRGTLIMHRDITLDLQIFYSRLHRCSRVQIGLQEAQALVSEVGAEDVWLAGHSLGSAIALLVGRNMVLKAGCHLQTYLFNPPFPSLPTQLITNEKMRNRIQAAHSKIKALVAAAVCAKIVEDDEAFASLFSWFPNLFINPSDPVCFGYIGYFKNAESRDGEAGRFAAQNSIRNMIPIVRRKDPLPSHLIPSADLTINCQRSSLSWRQAHRICQWWSPDLQLDYKRYHYQ